MQNFQPIRKRLGDLLVDTNLITSDQLAQALEVHRKKGIKLGHALVELNFITEDLLLAFLGRQCGISYVSLKEFGEICEKTVRSIPEHLARHWSVFPIRLQENELTVAVADPFNVFAVDDLKLFTGLEIKVAIAPADEIKKYIEKYYVEKGINSKNFPDNFLLKVVSYGIDLGANDIYFTGNTLRYFFNRNYLKTVQLNDKEAATLTKMLLSALAEADGKMFIYQDPHQKSSAPVTYSLIIKKFPETAVIKIKDISTVYQLRELGFEPNDILTFNKYLCSNRGVIIISSEPGCPACSATLVSAAASVALNQKVVYFLTDGIRRYGEMPFVIFSDKKNFPMVARSDFSSHYVFVDETVSVDAEAIVKMSRNSCVVIGTSDELLDGVTPRLYVRQKFVRRLCGNCKENYVVSKDYFTNSDIKLDVSGEEIILSKPVGCEACNYTGYSGKAVAYFMTEDYNNLTHEAIRKNMTQVLWKKALAGEISVEEVFLNNPDVCRDYGGLCV